jgi:hypothetical protein
VSVCLVCAAPAKAESAPWCGRAHRDVVRAMDRAQERGDGAKVDELTAVVDEHLRVAMAEAGEVDALDVHRAWSSAAHARKWRRRVTGAA